MGKYLTEFIGTFLFITAIGMSVCFAGNLAAIPIGVALMCMVYMGGHVSGAHYNPAVTLAVLLRGGGKINVADAVAYVGCQIAGAALAGLVVNFLTPADFTFAVNPGDGFNTAQILLNEFIWTFALALVVLNTATAKRMEGNYAYGLAIGFTIVFAAFAGGSVSGGAYNPAVGVGPNLIAGNFASIWYYLVGPLAGGALAAIVFKIQNPGE